MKILHIRASVLAAAAIGSLTIPGAGKAQEHEHGPPMAPSHDMWRAGFGHGWQILGMAQAFPILTVGAVGREGGSLRRTRPYLTQPAVMTNLESPGSVFVLRTTLNFEGLTIDDGELTPGAWGEGFIDKRHPHTLLHEFVASVNLREVAGGVASISAGKGFAPFGTGDPMSRPGVKYPTNHHLSQILERWMLSGAYLRDGWSVEAGVFGGTEPDGPYDFSNIESFGDSWSARLAKRWGGGGPMAGWEASISYARVVEAHEEAEETSALWNAALRHDRSISPGRLYFLLEGSRNDPEDGDGFFSVLGEARLDMNGGHQPYVRVEYASRPEYERDGLPGSDEFFRYDHDAEPIGSTRWLVLTGAYAYRATPAPVSFRPFVEVQYHSVREDRGGIVPATLLGADSFWNVNFGARIFFGGGPMRMGSYGALDAMSAMSAVGGPMVMNPER